MATRLELNSVLKQIVDNVYYQPPETIKLVYPCIVYSLEGDQVSHANDKIYTSKKRYTVTLIEKNPDSSRVDSVRGIPYCSFDRTIKRDNLYHYYYTLFF